MTVLLAFTLAGVVTYLLRAAMTLAGPSAGKLFGGWVPYVAPAALAALVMSALFVDRGQTVWPAVPQAIAVVLSMAVVYKTKNVSYALFVGFPAFWLAGAVPL